MNTPPPSPRNGSGVGLIADLRHWAEGAARQVDRFFFTPADPTTLGFMRIGAGVLTVFVHLCYCFGLLQYVGPHGWADWDVGSWVRHEREVAVPVWNWPKAGEPEVEVYDKGQYFWSIYYHVRDPQWILAIHYGILVAMVLFTLGFATRVTSVLTWLGAMQYVQRTPGVLLYGLDTMMMIVLLYLMIAPSGGALSLDRLLKRWRQKRLRGLSSLPELPVEPSVSANFATRLIQIHFCIIYLAAGTSKLVGSTWWGGSAPSLTLLNTEFAPFYLPAYVRLLGLLTQQRWLWEILMGVGVVFTLFTELGFPFLVWLRSFRWVMVCCSVLLHLMIGLIMGLIVFSLFMMVMVMAFIPPAAMRQFLDAAGQRLRRLVGRRKAAMSGPHKIPALSRG
jgi:hypothetical protein